MCTYKSISILKLGLQRSICSVFGQPILSRRCQLNGFWEHFIAFPSGVIATVQIPYCHFHELVRIWSFELFKAVVRMISTWSHNAATTVLGMRSILLGRK